MFKHDGRFYCFSPPVMIATFVIELSLLFWTFLRYKLDTTGRLIMAMLFFLALFQLSEFNVCQGHGLGVSLWSRIGFVAITALPPLGLHLIHSIAKKRARLLITLNYLTGLSFVVIFCLSRDAFLGNVCAGNYAIFQLTAKLGGYYFLYYYSWLIVGLLLSLWFAQRATTKIRESMLLLTVGYISFLLPTGIVNAVNPKTIEGIPSVMCGFAVIFAIILALKIAPNALKLKKP